MNAFLTNVSPFVANRFCRWNLRPYNDRFGCFTAEPSLGDSRELISVSEMVGAILSNQAFFIRLALNELLGLASFKYFKIALFGVVTWVMYW